MKKFVINRSLKAAMLVAVVFFLLGLAKKNDLPDMGALRPELFSAPVQTPTLTQPFTRIEGRYRAEIEPRQDYELSGLIVAAYDSENIFDYAHRHDPFNTRDICLLWGDNLKNDLYKRMAFSHGEFTCYYRAENQEDWQSFSPTGLSNNHLLPSDRELYRRLKKAQVGDQVRIKGQLVDYAIAGPAGQSGWRRTSLSRADQGNGACEVIFMNSFELLQAGQPVYRFLYRLSLYLFGFCLFSYIILFFLEIRQEMR